MHDAEVPGIGDPDLSPSVDGHAAGLVELSGIASLGSILRNGPSRRVEDLDAAVLRVGDVDVPPRVGGDSPRLGKLARTGAESALVVRGGDDLRVRGVIAARGVANRHFDR